MQQSNIEWETANTFVVYTKREGGAFHAMKATPEEYERWKENGVIDYWGDIDHSHPDAEPYRNPVSWIMLVRMVDDFDHVLKRSRGSWRHAKVDTPPLPDPL